MWLSFELLFLTASSGIPVPSGRARIVDAYSRFRVDQLSTSLQVAFLLPRILALVSGRRALAS